MRVALSLVLAILGTTIASPIANQPEVEITPFADGDIDYRLTDDIVPVRYDLEFTPFFEKVISPKFKP